MLVHREPVYIVNNININIIIKNNNIKVTNMNTMIIVSTCKDPRNINSTNPETTVDHFKRDPKH